MDKGINIKVDAELYRDVKVKIAYEGITLREYIIKLIKQDLEKK